jgi:hypothetical protein
MEDKMRHTFIEWSPPDVGARVIDGEVFIPARVIEEVNEALAILIMSDKAMEMAVKNEQFMCGWAEGAMGVMSLYKRIHEALLEEFASDLVPDTVPDNLV